MLMVVEDDCEEVMHGNDGSYEHLLFLLIVVVILVLCLWCLALIALLLVFCLFVCLLLLREGGGVGGGGGEEQLSLSILIWSVCFSLYISPHPFFSILL